MSFRKVLPLFRDSSASASNPTQSTSESSGSDLRRNRGEKEVSRSSSSSKRRRVPESVTQNACLECKKARAKCDGKKPCKRCASRAETSECIYEVHIKYAKEELVKQIKELKAKDHLTQQILQALSTNEKVPDILERLRNGEKYEKIVEWLDRPLQDHATTSPRESHQSTSEAPDHEMGSITGTGFQWTSVTADSAVLDHLFMLYFTWVHPVYTLFSEGHFVNSYRQQSDQYCSEVLVNVMCAMACHLHSASEKDKVDFEQLSLEFSDAARHNIDPNDMSLTTIQAFAVLFLIYCARGDGLRGSVYLKVATDNLASIVSQNASSHPEVLNTIRGVCNLNIEWAQITFKVPDALITTPMGEDKENNDELDDAKWYFYRYVNDQCPAWPGLLATTNREKFKLIRIIHDVETMMYTQQGPRISALDILQQYNRYVTWRKELPGIIGDIEENNNQALPHVLSLLILYSVAVVHLLRPLLDLDGFPSQYVNEVIWNYAQHGLFLLDAHYRAQYTCRYQPVLQMFAVAHLSDVILRFFPTKVDAADKDGPEALLFGMEALGQSGAGFPLAGPLQEMLRRSGKQCSVPLPPNLDELMIPPRPPKPSYGMDDLLDACTRPTYVQPVYEIHKRYLPSFCTDWATHEAMCGFREPNVNTRILKGASAEERGVQSVMQIRNMLNVD